MLTALYCAQTLRSFQWPPLRGPAIWSDRKRLVARSLRGRVVQLTAIHSSPLGYHSKAKLTIRMMRLAILHFSPSPSMCLHLFVLNSYLQHLCNNNSRLHCLYVRTSFPIKTPGKLSKRPSLRDLKALK